MIGLGEALHRLDEDDQALGQWEAATQLAENEHTYTAWRNVAAARVRGGDLRGALNAYREADRRAPQADKPEIAARMGWLSKELGDGRASGRYFAQARGDAGFSFAIGVIAVTSIVSILASFIQPGVIPASLCGPGAEACDLFTILQLDKVLVAAGELYRLWTVTLVHAPVQQMPLHLIFNMYLLYLDRPGRREDVRPLPVPAHVPRGRRRWLARLVRDRHLARPAARGGRVRRRVRDVRAADRRRVHPPPGARPPVPRRRGPAGRRS